MVEFLTDIYHQYAGLFYWLTGVSAVTIMVLLTFGVRILAKLPADYFLDDQRRTAAQFWNHYPTYVRWSFVAAKNLLGASFVILGLIFLLTPGQGFLTILAGFLMMNFPGKYDAERWLVRRPQVKRSIDYLRKRAGQPPLKVR
jgi:hypothetical protein